MVYLRLFKISLFLISLSLSCSVYGQATIYFEDFDAVGYTGVSTNDLTPNFWTTGDCAGNGPSAPGVKSLNITKGGVGIGCGPTGDIHYAYDNSPAGVRMATQYTTIDATCASSLQLDFDYQIDGTPGEDFLEIVYSTDGGTSWFVVGPQYSLSGGWQTTNSTLPALLDNTVFELGVRFTYNDVTINGNPPAVDNILVTGVDNTPPLLSCPGALDLPVSAGCQPICIDYAASMLTLSDNCTDSVLIAVTQSIPVSTLLAGGVGDNSIITLTAEDEAGNTSACNITLNFIDGDAPTLSCPGDTNIYVDVNCDGLVEDYTGDIITSDNCTSFGNLLIVQSVLPGTVINGTIIVTPVTISVEDESGNVAQCTFDTRTIDTMVATITCPLDTFIYADNACDAQMPDYTGDVLIYDNCTSIGSLTVTQLPLPGSMHTSDQVVTLTVSGAIPNVDQSCTFNATFIDTIAPTIVCPPTTSAFVNGSCLAITPDYTGSGASSDNCDPFPAIVQSPLPGTSIPLSPSTLITLTISDASGNSAACQFTQLVTDNIAPVITCPLDQTLSTDAACSASLSDYLPLASATDNCSASLNYTQSPGAGTIITATTAVTITVEDESSNSTNCIFNVNLIDDVNPVVTCPVDQNAFADAGCTYVMVDFTGSASATDNCSLSGTINLTQVPVAGMNVSSGTHVITITAEDEENNLATCQFNVTVDDNTAPIISDCGANPTIYVDANCEVLLSDLSGNVVANDNCSAPVDLLISQSPLPGTALSVSTIVTLSVADEVGNVSNCAITVSVLDTIQPAPTCPPTQTVAIDGSCNYLMPDLTGLANGSDNCTSIGNLTITQNPVIGSVQNAITAVLITVSDEQGNNATCLTQVVPNDLSAPTISCPNPAPVHIGTACDLILPDYGTVSSVLDNCSDYSIVQTPTPGTIVLSGTQNIDLVVTDAGGNTDQCSFDLVIYESQVPLIACPSPISTCDPMISYSAPVFSDNCLVSLIQTDVSGLSSGMLFPIGITALQYTAIDSSGNTASCSFTVEVLEYPSFAHIMEDTLIMCDLSSTLISADASTSGTGEWTLLTGEGAFNNQFANTTGVNNIGYGENAYVWTISTTTCGNTADTLIVINYQQDVQASTLDTIYSCSDETVILLANSPLYGSGLWTTNATGVIADPSLPNTTSTTANGWQQFIWTISNGTCPTTSDTLSVFSMKKPIIDQPDTLVCIENDGITLSALTQPLAAGQNSYWQILSGEGSLSDPYSITSEAYGFDYSVTLITYTVSHPQCGSLADTIRISGNLCEGFHPVIPTVFTPGNLDGSNDLFQIDFLDIVYPNCTVMLFNRWGSVVYESTGYADPWDGTHNGEPLPMGTYFYNIHLNDGFATELKGDISIIR